MSEVNKYLLRAKSNRRRELARAPIEEKVRVLVSLQQATSKIDRQVGRPARSTMGLSIDKLRQMSSIDDNRS